MLDGTIDSIRNRHGGCLLRARMAQGVPIPDQIDGVVERSVHDGDVVLELSEESARPRVLQALSAAGDVEHFETVRPSLHDIFVKIAKPDPNQLVGATATGDE